MKVALVRIGNSRGVRLPKAVLDEVRLTDAANLTVEGGRIVLTPIGQARADWAARFDQDPNFDLTQEDLEWLEAPLDHPEVDAWDEESA
jgi:antitoxin MazE